LICKDAPCIEKACTNPNNNNGTKVIPTDVKIDKQVHTPNPNDTNNDTKKNFNILLIVLILLSLFIILIAISISIYLKSFKKKEEDPIPIFSVEDSSYCYEPPLSMDKSLINASKNLNNDQQKISYNNTRKNINQIGLSVQLQRFNPINDYSSQISQNSNRSRTTNNTYRIKQDNYNNEVKSELSGHSNFGSPPISPISISSSVPIVSVQKINKKKSLKSDISINKNNKNYYNPPSPYGGAESPTVVEAKPKITDKHSNYSSHTKNEKESSKVLSSKHYVLSTFEGDYDKEELNLHYGDIVSVINIYPDGWAYGELLMKYNSYGSNIDNDKVKLDTKSKQRKFGYYPIKCLSLNEDTDEVVPEPPKNMKEVKNQNLKPIDIPADDSNSYNYNDGKDMYEREKASLLYPISPLSNNSSNVNDNNNNNSGESVNSSKNNKININQNDNSNNSINSNNNNKNNINNNIDNDGNNKNDNHKDNNNHKNNDHYKDKNNQKTNDKQKDNDNHKNDSDNNKKKLIRMHKRSASNTINTRSSKRSSIFNLFKRASRDFSMTSKEVIHIYSEPNSSHKKQNSIENSFNDTDSTTETIYHDARGEEAIVEVANSNSPYNKSYNLNRLSVRSFISFRSY